MSLPYQKAVLAALLLGFATALGAVERTSAGVSMGLGLWELGERSAVLRQLREAALPELIELYEGSTLSGGRGR